MSYYTYKDANGEKIHQDDRVVMPDDGDCQDRGTIIAINDPEGDVDDEGRTVYHAPSIRVHFDNGDVESFALDTWGDPRNYYPDGVDTFCAEEFVLLHNPETPDFGDISEDQDPEVIAEQVEQAYRDGEVYEEKKENPS
jgi:hypothetical protein